MNTPRNWKTSSQDGGTGKHSSSPHMTIAKITAKLQNDYHPQSSENQGVWKSNKQGIKEVTFIQEARSGRNQNGWSHTHVY